VGKDKFQSLTEYVQNTLVGYSAGKSKKESKMEERKEEKLKMCTAQ
jgi:hypothetical protein